MCVCVCSLVNATRQDREEAWCKWGWERGGTECVWQPWHLLPRINKSSQNRQLIHPSGVVPEAVMLKRGAKGLGNGWTRQGEAQA